MDKDIDGKEWRDFPSIKGYLNKKYVSLKKQREGAREKQRQLGTNEMNAVEKRLDLANVEVIGST